MSIVLSFFLVLFLIIVLLYGFKQVLQNSNQKGWFQKFGLQSQNLQVCESLTLDPKRRVVILRVLNDEYVILLGIQNETVLGKVNHQPFADLLTEKGTDVDDAKVL